MTEKCCSNCFLGKEAKNFVGHIPLCVLNPNHPKHLLISLGFIPESFPKPFRPPSPNNNKHSHGQCDAPELFSPR